MCVNSATGFGYLSLHVVHPLRLQWASGTLARLARRGVCGSACSSRAYGMGAGPNDQNRQRHEQVRQQPTAPADRAALLSGVL